MGPTIITSTIAYAITVLLYLTLISCTLWRNVHSRVSWAFVIFLFGLTLWTATLYLYFFVDLGDSLLFWGRLNYTANVFTPVGLLAFFYYFPEAKKNPATWITWLITCETVGLALLTQFTPLIDQQEIYGTAGPEVTLGSGYLLFVSHILCYLLLALGLGFRKLKLLNGIEAARIRYPIFVFVGSCLLLLINNAILPIFGIEPFWQYSFIIMTPVALTAYYVIHNYRLFNFSFLLLKTLRLTILILLTGGAGSLGVGVSHLMHADPFWGTIGSSVVAFLTLLIGQRYIPDLIPENIRELKIALRDLTTESYACETQADLNAVVEQIFVIRLHIAHAKIDTTPSALRQYQALKKIQTREEWLEQYQMRTHAAVLIPLIASKRLIGVLELGAKTNGTAFSAEELHELEKAQRLLSNCYLNLLVHSKLSHENKILKQIVADKTKDLTQRNQDMRRLTKQQSDFIRLAAHELRTPLTLATLDLDEILIEGENTQALSIKKSLEKLNRLIENLFTAELFDLHKPKLQPVTITCYEFIQDIITDFTLVLSTKGIHLTIDNQLQPATQIKGDPAFLRQVFQNIINNAAEVTPRGQKIMVQTTEDAHQITVCITDQGPGIPPANQKLIFEKFRSGKAKRGLGLGLYICKQIILAHRGTIWVENAPTGSARFCFTLPKI